MEVLLLIDLGSRWRLSSPFFIVETLFIIFISLDSVRYQSQCQKGTSKYLLRWKIISQQLDSLCIFNQIKRFTLFHFAFALGLSNRSLEAVMENSFKLKWTSFLCKVKFTLLQSKFFPAIFFFCILEKGILAGKNLLDIRVNQNCKEGVSN